MPDYYNLFICPKKITKDINFYYDRIIDLIKNDIFSQYIFDRKKKIIKKYVIDNYLSKINYTRLRFKNDKIIITFINDEIPECKLDLYFKNYKIDNLVLEIYVYVSINELKNKILYDHNKSFHILRKKIVEINTFYNQKIKQKEEHINKKIYDNLSQITFENNFVWQRLLDFLKDYTNIKNYYDNLEVLEEILKGIKTDVISVLFKATHQTQFYIKNCRLRKIKYKTFIKQIQKDFDENEIIKFTNKIASCYNHKINHLKQALSFLYNIIYYVNVEYINRESDINMFISNCWKNEN